MSMRILHKIIILFILVATLPILVAGLRIIDIARNSKETSVLERHIEKTREVSSQIDFYIDKWTDAMLVLAISQEQETLQLDQDELQSLLLSMVESYDDITLLQLFDSEGNQQTVAKETALESMRNNPQPYLPLLENITPSAQRAIATNEIIRENVQIIPELNKIFLIIAVPLHRQNTNPEALVGIIDLAVLQSTVRQRSHSEEQSEYRREITYIIDRQGRLLAHPEPTRFRKGENLSSQPFIQQVLNNRTENFTTQFVNQDETPMLGAATFSTKVPWVIILEQPLKDAYFSVDQMRKNLWAWVLVGIGLAVAFAFVFAELFNRPIAKFANAARSVASGNFDQSVQVNSRDELGELAAVFNEMIVELKRYDEINVNKLISEQAKIQAIIRNIADGIIAADTQRCILFLNEQAEQWFGVSNEESQQKALVSSIKNEKLDTLIGETLGNPQENSAELTIVDAQNLENRVLKAHAAPVTDGKKEIIGVVTALRDITREKEIDRMKSEIVSVVSHELRTPLTSIQGFSQLLVDESITPEQRRTYANLVVNEAERLTNMVNEFLDLSRLESGRVEIHKEPFNLIDNITNIVFVVSKLADEKNIAILPQFDDDDIFVDADPDMINQVMMNLLSNAIKYSPRDRQVILSVVDKGRTVEIAIKDQGFGMKPVDAEKIFDKFYRVKSDDTREIGGTGLGLPIVKEIIERHGKEIVVISELGKGSEFVFELDKVKPTSQSPEETLLDMLETGQQKVQKETFNIIDIILNSVFAVSEAADEKHIAILPQFDDDDILVHASMYLIGQTMIYLLDNAVKYSPPEQEVFVQVTTEKEMVKITVKDYGFGIEPSYLNKIFEPYYRIESEEAEGIRGVGLGLTLVKKIIELHGSTITVNSEKGGGSEFTFWLERAEKE